MEQKQAKASKSKQKQANASNSKQKQSKASKSKQKQAKASKSEQKHYIPHSAYFGDDAGIIIKLTVNSKYAITIIQGMPSL